VSHDPEHAPFRNGLTSTGWDLLPLTYRPNLKFLTTPVASPGFGVRGHDDRGAKGASIEAPSGVGYGERCPLRSRLGGLVEHRDLPQRGPGQSPGRYRIFCIFRPQNASDSKKNTACIKLQGARAPVPGDATELHTLRRYEKRCKMYKLG